MSNVLKVSIQNAIVALVRRGHSIRKIARELGVNRRTVRRYVLGTDLGPVPGADPSAKCTTSAEEVTPGTLAGGEAKCTTPEAEVTPGSRSGCAPYREVILGMVEAGLSAQRVYEDLRAGHGFGGSYSSVKRFVAKVSAATPQRVWRVECEPGQEMQVDFMSGPMLPDLQRPGQRKRCWILRAVLSHSRKGYSEAVWRQDTESFLRVLENAMRHFGGVPALLNLDNLKAAVSRADWCDPDLSPKFAEFCRHYGITPMPCRPYQPQHKGKVERSVLYVRNNALAGRDFEALTGVNDHLRDWESGVADTRIHGTTRRQVGEHFRQVERPALQPLPTELFAAFQEARRRVHRDGYVEVAKAYYHVPPEYIGRQVWVRWDGRQVRILNERLDQIASHVRIEPGHYSQVRGVGGLDQAGTLEQTAEYWRKKAATLGPAAGLWAQGASAQRGARAIRSIQGLWALGKKFSPADIDAACAAVMAAEDAPLLRAIRQRLKDTTPLPRQQLMPFEQSHPLIRELSHYDLFVQNQSQNQNHTQACEHQTP